MSFWRRIGDALTGRPLWLLAVVALLLLLYRLDGTSFRGRYDDVDRSLIARNMVESGDWLQASYLGKPLYTKPPLMYWTAAAIGRVSGRRDELPGNLTSVLGMLTLILATGWAGRALFGHGTGLRAGLLLATMHLTLSMGRQAILDTVMLAGFGVTLAALLQLACVRPRRTTGWWLAAAAGLAVALLTKGPVIVPVLLLIWLPLAPWRDGPRPTRRQAAGMAALLLAVLLPWPLLLLHAAPEALTVWKSEVFGRFGDGRQFHAWTQKPVWFYLPDLINTMPWLPLLPWAAAVGWRRRREPAWRLLLWWTLGGLAFFSLASATKRSYYLLPLYPGFALLIAGAWDEFARARARDASRRRGLPGLLGGFIALCGAAFVALPWFYPGLPRTAWTLAGAAALAAGAASLAAARRERWPAALQLAIAGAAALHLAWFGHLVPVVNTFHSGKPFYQEADRLLGDDPVVLCEVPLTLAVFYLPQRPWSYVKRDGLRALAAAGTGQRVITRPHLAAAIPGLEAELVREFAEPFGQKKGLGLYRLPQAAP